MRVSGTHTTAVVFKTTEELVDSILARVARLGTSVHTAVRRPFLLNAIQARTSRVCSRARPTVSTASTVIRALVAALSRPSACLERLPLPFP